MLPSKICIVCMNNLIHMTQANIYTDNFEKNQISYDLIYLDSYGIEENNNASVVYKLDASSMPQRTKLQKIKKYINFRRFAIKLLKANNYQHVVIWNEITAMVLSGFLEKYYTGRYSVNIRDHHFADTPIIRNIYSNVIKNSEFTTVSSERFIQYLPNQKYYLIHSFSAGLYKAQIQVHKKNESGPLKIQFVGRLSYKDTALRFVNAMKNDSRFIIGFAGIKCDELLDSTDNIENLEIHGKFDPSETLSFLKDADILYTLNKQGETFSETLTPIKFYYAAQLNIPVLCYEGSFTSELAKRCAFDISINDFEFSCLPEIIYQRYMKIDFDKSKESCASFMKSEIKDNQVFDEYLTHKYFDDFS